MSVLEIGCCGAVCKTCPPYRNKACRGCKTGYENGERDITKARCRIKVCCIGKGIATCGDCSEYETCDRIREWQSKTGYKYQKYRETLEYIRDHGYDAFLKKSADWKNAYGKLE